MMYKAAAITWGGSRHMLMRRGTSIIAKMHPETSMGAVRQTPEATHRTFFATDSSSSSGSVPAASSPGSGSAAGGSIQTTTTGNSAPAATSQAKSSPQPEGKFRTATRAMWQRLTSFIVGMALGGTVAYVKLHNDIWDSTVQMEQTVRSLEQDVVKSNQDLRKRVAALEHQLNEPARK